jgi:integrase
MGFFWGQRMGATKHDTRFLEQHHGSWRVVVGWRVNGRVVKARRSLGTSSLREAQRRRWAVVAELKSTVCPDGGQPAQDADGWRAALKDNAGGWGDVDAAFGDTLDRLPPTRAAALAQQVYQTPLDLHLSAFITSRGNVGVDTRVRHERAVRDLTRWLPTPHTVEAVTRKLAIQYTDQLPPGRQDPQRLSLYWQWMVRREHATSDPWDGLQATQRRPVEPERPWTDAEAMRLLEGDCSPSLKLLMQVAALSGARLDAILNSGVEDGCWVFPPQKKETQARRVPIHSSLSKAASDYSFPWPTSAAASHAFTYYRRKVLGPDEPGRRRAVVNFHSWRRWFISKAEQAGQPENVIAAVVGHRRPGLTFGRYSSGPGVELMRACVESVKLPLPQTGAPL